MPIRLLLDDGVVAIGQQALAHGVGVFAVAEGADLDVVVAVAGRGAGGDAVAPGAECANEHLGVFLVGDGGDLDEKGAGLPGLGALGRW